MIRSMEILVLREVQKDESLLSKEICMGFEMRKTGSINRIGCDLTLTPAHLQLHNINTAPEPL